MKKLLLSIFLIISINATYAQWKILDSTNLIGAIWLFQPNDGWAFGPDFRHWDGTNWTTVLQDSAFNAQTCAFPTPNDGWVFGSQDSVYRYNGLVWTKQYLGISDIGSCSFYDSDHGWTMSATNVYKYLNGTWSQYTNQLPSYIPGSIYRTVEAIGTNTALIGGYSLYSGPGFLDSSYIFNTSTNPWQIDTSVSGIEFRAISFPDQNHGWALGKESNMIYDKLFRYNGNGWKLDQTFAGHSDAVGMYMYSNNLGWLSRGEAWAATVYSYDGFSWTVQDTLNDIVKQFSFADPLNGWALLHTLGHPSSSDRNWLYYTTTAGVGKEKYNSSSILSELIISPNPFSQSTQISLNQTYQNIALAVFDIQGKQVAQQHYTHCSQIQLNRNQLPNGLYFVKLTLDDKHVETVKVVIND